MPKKWLKVSETKIYDLNKFDCFWSEQKAPDKFIVYGGVFPLEGSNVYLLYHFTDERDVKQYIEMISQFLSQDEECQKCQ